MVLALFLILASSFEEFFRAGLHAFQCKDLTMTKASLGGAEKSGDQLLRIHLPAGTELLNGRRSAPDALHQPVYSRMAHQVDTANKRSDQPRLPVPPQLMQ